MDTQCASSSTIPTARQKGQRGLTQLMALARKKMCRNASAALRLIVTTGNN